MRIALALALALLLAACGGAATPSRIAAPPLAPSEPPSPAPTAVPTPTPIAQTPAPVTHGARIDLYRFPLAPGAPTDRQQAGGMSLHNADQAEWLSEWREPGFAFTRLVPSWNATTPEGTWLKVEVQARRASGGETKIFSFGIWTYGDAVRKRTSADDQRDADARVDTDTLLASVPLSAYRMKVTIGRDPGVIPSPILRGVTVVVSDDATVRAAGPSAHTGVVKDIAVPQLSQQIHAGEYPEWDGGGEAWCSPTSTSMVLAHWGRGPTPQDVVWVDPRYVDQRVDHAARFSYDARYGGTGNWSYNVAYAAQYGVNAFVTQLRSLAEAERFIAAGIPLVASVHIPAGGLPGFPLPQGAAGHLLVIRGFTQSGDVISNDPAGPNNDSVRRVYPRASFEKVWIGGSGGIVYVIHPPEIALPPRVDGATPNW